MYVDANLLLQATDGGLKIILHYYPQAGPCVENSRRKFKMRESEKTASATLKQLPDGNWVVTDFGGDAKPKNGIEICRDEEGLSYKEALQVLAQRYGIDPEKGTIEILKPKITKTDATPEQEEGKWYFEVRKGFTEFEVRTVLAANVIPYIKTPDGDKINFEKVEKVFLRYNFYSLDSYTIIKNREAIRIESTEQYPIMMWDEGKFKKIYQPLSPDKSRRFMYYGQRPTDFLHGLAACNIAYENNFPKDAKEELDPDTGEVKKPTPVKLPEIIYCSGGSDGMNVAMIDNYQVVWGNSETAKLTGVQLKKLTNIAERVMNLPDIDETGLREAHRLALEHLQLYTIELPEQLRAMPDRRGNPSKDVRDFFKHFRPYELRQLVKTALPYQFWEEYWSKDKDTGKFKTSYQVRNTRMYNFLRKNGFGRIELENEKTGYLYIQIIHNIVREIKANEVKNYVNKFLETRGMDEILRDTFYRSTQVNEGSMSNLPIVDIDFSNSEADTQFFFYENGTVSVQADGIKIYKPGEIRRYVWEDEVVKHRIKLDDPYFKVTTLPDGTLDIEILKKDCDFLNYMINTCRMHWRKELEESLDGKSDEEREAYLKKHKFDIAGPNLDPMEQAEQKQHLINRIYAAGYLLHGFKDESRAWCVFGMDNRVGDDGESHGGTGKSIFFKAIRQFMKTVTLDGRKDKLTEDQFLFENVTRHTGYILIDDANQYLNFQFFFSSITGELTVNPKHGKRFIIPFEEVAKFAISSNFVIRNLDSSTARRLLYTVFSDYYHANQPGHDYYREDRTVADDFGYNLLSGSFPQEQWNSYFNLMMQCCQMYLNYPKISPPMNNVEVRHLKSEMGENFLEWADVYFSEESGRLNQFVPRPAAFEDFKITTNSRLWSAQKFFKSIQAWCRFYSYTLDPKEYRNSKGRIIRKHENEHGKTVTTEMIYIRTTEGDAIAGDDAAVIEREARPKQSPNADTGSILDEIPEDKLPF
jgi:hypothetical protein